MNSEDNRTNLGNVNDWLLKYGVVLVVGVAVLTLCWLAALGFGLVSDTFSRGFVVFSLLLIALFVWTGVTLLARSHSLLAQLQQSVAEQAKLTKSKQALDQKQQLQAQLEFVQAERLYLIEKAQLQPIFKAVARPFITPPLDYEFQDEVWDEDAFIAKHFKEPDLFGVKLTFRQKGNTLFSHERVIFDRSSHPSDRTGSHSNEAYVTLDEKEKPVYIIPLDELPGGNSTQQFVVYYIYKDITSLSVVMKYRVSPAIEGDANFWSINNLDICFSNAYHQERQLDSVENCESLFEKKYLDPLLS